jgi:hypothetical protein
MSYYIIPRGKNFWVVRFLSDGTYEAVKKHASKAEAERAIETLESDDDAASGASRKAKAR